MRAVYELVERNAFGYVIPRESSRHVRHNFKPRVTVFRERWWSVFSAYRNRTFPDVEIIGQKIVTKHSYLRSDIDPLKNTLQIGRKSLRTTLWNSMVVLNFFNHWDTGKVSFNYRKTWSGNHSRSQIKQTYRYFLRRSIISARLLVSFSSLKNRDNNKSVPNSCCSSRLVNFPSF